MKEKVKTVKKLIMIVCITLISINSYSQVKTKTKVQKTNNCPICNIDVVKSTDDSIKINRLSKSQMLCFLKGFNAKCYNNEKYSAHSNMVLYSLIKGYPDEFVDLIYKNKDIKSNYIYNELANLLIIKDMDSILVRYKYQPGDNTMKKRIKDNITFSLKKSLK